MSLFRRNQKASTPKRAKSLGMRLTEGMLPVFGPAQVGDLNAPIRPTSKAEDARESALEAELVRKLGADGSTYLVQNRDA